MARVQNAESESRLVEPWRVDGSRSCASAPPIAGVLAIGGYVIFENALDSCGPGQPSHIPQWQLWTALFKDPAHCGPVERHTNLDVSLCQQ